MAIYLSEQNNSNQYAKKYNLQNGCILENAIEDRFFDVSMQHTGEKKHEEGIQYLFVANYGENKNHDMLLSAYSHAQIGKSQLVFVGFEENEYLDMLRQHEAEWLKEQAEKEVVFGVGKSREEVYELYRRSDIFVCSSKSETWSIVVHEAAATGMTIISTDVGTIGRIEGTTIVATEQEMKEAMELLYYDDDLRQKNGKKAARWMEDQNCRISDKVEWLEQRLKQLQQGKE